jgi:hypothetical protein
MAARLTMTYIFLHPLQRTGIQLVRDNTTTVYHRFVGLVLFGSNHKPWPTRTRQKATPVLIAGIHSQAPRPGSRSIKNSARANSVDKKQNIQR